MRPLLRIALIVCLAFVASGCGIVRSLLIGHASTPVPGETSAPPPAGASQGSGCVQGIWQVRPDESQPITPEILELTRTIIQHRMEASGAVPFLLATTAADQIDATFPAFTDQDQLRSLIGMRGQLLFIPIPTSYADLITEGRPLPDGMPADPIFPPDQIASARPGTTSSGSLAVDIQLKSAGAALFDAYAAANFGERFAIVLDGIVQSAPTINATRFDGQANISGSFDAATMKALVVVLNFGPFPLPVKELAFGPGSCDGAGS